MIVNSCLSIKFSSLVNNDLFINGEITWLHSGVVGSIVYG